MANVSVKPKIFQWAIERSGLDETILLNKFPDFPDWLQGGSFPSLKNLEEFARKTLTPLGYFFLDNPPDETLPVTIFRTVGDRPIHTPSPNLIETFQTIQRRQDWVREFLVEEGSEPLGFVGSVTTKSNPVDVASEMRKTFGITDRWARQHSSWNSALDALRQSVDEAGIFIVKNGIVGNNTSRKLDVDEFRGFVLIDKYAPFIFVNGCDFEGAQMFTIAHELAHIWTGQSAVFNLLNLLPFDDANEEFCNKIAAEFLVPGKEFTAEWEEARRTKDRFKTLSPHFKVSQLVIARRALDLGFIDKTAFFAFYKNYRDEIEEKVKKKKEKKKGKNEQEGDFYNNQNVRVGKRFAAAVFQATQEGRLLYRDAFRLTGLYGPVFDRYKSKIGL